MALCVCGDDRVVVELEMLVIADVLLSMYLSFESITTTTSPNSIIPDDPSITTTPLDDDELDAFLRCVGHHYSSGRWDLRRW